jgi:ribonuclease J
VTTTTTTTTTTTALRLTPLGGVGQFGRNCLLVEHLCGDVAGDAFLVDCGIRFAGPELPGFDGALPDLERLDAVGDRLRAIVITHGHEDHIGALPFVLRGRRVPVLCTAFTAHFIKRRLARHELSVVSLADVAGGADVGERDVVIDVVPFGAVRQIGNTDTQLTFAAVSHSIPGAAAAVFSTAVGVIVHSGDFRIDPRPILGPPTDMATLIAAAGDTGVRCLLADSTGALTNDDNDATATAHAAGVERSVFPKLQRCFRDDAGGAFAGVVVVGLFASHLQRLALLAEVCRRENRKLVLLGTGLKEVFAMAQAHLGDENGDAGSFLHPENGAAAFADVVIDERSAQNLPRHRLCFAATGTQGERMAALGRLSRSDGQLPVRLGPGDRAVFSARIIPGNELAVQAVVDGFVNLGVDVVVGRSAPHISGHGGQRDLRALISATRPHHFVALHGTPGHLVGHGRVATALGLKPEQVFPLRNGHSIVIDADSARHVDAGAAAEPASVGDDVCDFPRGIASTRLRLRDAGVVVVDVSVVNEDGANTVVITDIVARGVFPAIDMDGATAKAWTRTLNERHRSGLPLDNDDAEKALKRPWKRGFVPAPELIIRQR